MSMHFAPQWVKPIKPTGPAAMAGDVPPPSARQTHHSTPSHPFPALNPGRSSPTVTTPTNPVMSYSKITNAASPQSPSFPSDGGSIYGDNGNAHPFRYSREYITGLWDTEKVKEVPIELADLMESAGVLVSKEVVKPVGLRDLSEVEKKLLATSVHPTNPVRQRMPANNDRSDRVERTDREQANGHVIRRPNPPPTNGKDAASAPGSGRGAFGGFGRGEGGAFGGGKIGTIGTGPPSVGLETRGPGTMGGGFGGVPKRIGRRTESTDLGADVPAARVAAPWRTTRTTSGTFEGVLGFNQSQPTPTANAGTEAVGGGAPGWRERQEKERLEKERAEKEKIEEVPAPTFGKGGGPGWGNGQKKWRLAAGLDQDKTLDMPTPMAISESVVATASATPVPERDATMRDVSVPQSNAPAPQSEAQEKEDLGSVLWYYRDPAGDEQGSFTGTQMHDWYSHAYFTDDLPLRRSHETGFHTLSELKVATGNSVQPFLSPVRPRLPPNLPIPSSAMPLSSPGINGTPVDSFRNLAINSPAQPAYNQYMPDRTPFSAAQFGQFGQQQIPSPGFGSPAAAAPWGGLGPRTPVDNFGIRSPFGGDQFGAGGPQLYSPAPGAPVYAQHQVPYGVPPPNPNPWGVPGMPQQGQPMPMYNQAPGQPAMSPMPEQYQPQTVPPPQQQQQQYEPEPEPEAQEIVLDEPSYFPPVEAEPQQSVEEAAYEAAKKQLESNNQQSIEASPALEPEAEVETPTPADKPPAAPPASVWGQVTPRKQSIAEPSPIPAPAASAKPLPPAPSSLPPKPIAIPAQVAETSAKPSPSTPSQPTPAKPAPAPWAAKEDRPATPTGLSLREIQEAEARAADLRRAALSEARASAQPAVSSIDTEVPANMSWGLPSSGQGKTATPAPASPATPVPAWGSGDAGPKKTLKQIQEEEERRKKAVQAAAMAKAVAAGGAASASTKRGYADLAANASAPPAGWSTVGLGGKVIPGAAPKPAGTIPTKPILASTTSALPKPSVVSAPTKKANGGADDLLPPSVDFLKWVKGALTGLKTPADDFIQMLLTFPVDPPTASRSEMLEIISDSVYANSATLDGRRFAAEFYEKRKADAKRGAGGAKVGSGGGVATGYSLADVVKSVPAKKEDVGFKVVKAKGKKKN